MKLGEPVIFVADWSSFVGKRGHVTQVHPFVMVVLDDDPRPIRVGEREVVPASETAHHAGAE